MHAFEAERVARPRPRRRCRRRGSRGDARPGPFDVEELECSPIAAHRPQQLDLHVAAAREPDLERARSAAAAEVVVEIGRGQRRRTRCTRASRASPAARRRSRRRRTPAGTDRRRSARAAHPGGSVPPRPNGSRRVGHPGRSTETAGIDAGHGGGTSAGRARALDRDGRGRGTSAATARSARPHRRRARSPPRSCGLRAPEIVDQRTVCAVEQPVAPLVEIGLRAAVIAHHQHGGVGLHGEDHEHLGSRRPRLPRPRPRPRSAARSTFRDDCHRGRVIRLRAPALPRDRRRASRRSASRRRESQLEHRRSDPRVRRVRRAIGSSGDSPRARLGRRFRHSLATAEATRFQAAGQHVVHHRIGGVRASDERARSRLRRRARMCPLSHFSTAPAVRRRRVGIASALLRDPLRSPSSAAVVLFAAALGGLGPSLRARRAPSRGSARAWPEPRARAAGASWRPSSSPSHAVVAPPAVQPTGDRPRARHLQLRHCRRKGHGRRSPLDTGCWPRRFRSEERLKVTR